MIEPLEEKGLVIEDGIGDSTGGRKPILYAVNDKEYYVGAVNISTTYCEVSIMNFRMEILIAQNFGINFESTPESVIDCIANIFDKQLVELQIEKCRVLGIGVSVFSSFDKETGKIHRPMILYVNEQWVNFPLAQQLEEKLGIHVEVQKGTNAAAMLEYFYGIGKGSNCMLYVLCAMNIRSAVISSGQLLSIAPGYEDAFGHMTINFDGEECLCGNYGCVDCYTTIPAIIDKVAIEIKKGRPTSLKGPASKINFKDICLAAENGDSLSKDVITSAACTLGIALANYINLFCPDMVILSGLLVRESSIYYDVAVSTAKKKSIFIADGNKVVFEKKGHFADPITAGAGSIMIESLINQGEKP